MSIVGLIAEAFILVRTAYDLPPILTMLALSPYDPMWITFLSIWSVFGVIALACAVAYGALRLAHWEAVWKR